ncbi:MAG TPA: ACP S-malonyltransferase [Chthoniobacterales bacterium]
MQKKTRIYVFPGQGSQKVGMGAELFGRFTELVATADAELGYSIEELCLRDSSSRLNQTQFTQPALFVVNALSYLNHLLETGRLPRFVAGHSLGEYNALFAAGVFDFRTGIRLVQRRAHLMAKASGGGMAAVIGLSVDQIHRACGLAGVTGIDIANLNSPNQVVISGPEPDLAAVQPDLERAGAQLIRRLPVSAAFHSRYMAEAGRVFQGFLEGVTFHEPRIPVISNVTARPYQLAETKEVLARQITHAVRWVESVQWLLLQPEPDFLELGPGNVLTGLIRRIKTEGNRLSVTP